MSSRREFLTHSGVAVGALAAAAAAPAGMPSPQSSSKKIRIGVVGGGFGSQFHWDEHPNCAVAAVTDLRSDRRQTLQEVYRCNTAYPSLEVMLRDHKELDAVAVFSGAVSKSRCAWSAASTSSRPSRRC